MPPRHRHRRHPLLQRDRHQRCLLRGVDLHGGRHRQPGRPGSATESVTAHTFGTCTSNVLGVLGVTSVTVNNLPYTTVVGSDGSVSVTPAAGSTIQTTVVLRTLLGSINCVYQAPSLTGTTGAADNSINFTAQAFTKTSGSSLCFANGYFTAKYAPVTDVTQGGATVFVN